MRAGVNRGVQKPQNKITMKKFLSIITVLAISAGVANAGCGKTVTSEGTLKSFDEASKSLVVADKAGKETKITLTPTTKGADQAKSLVGKAVKVDAEHGKASAIVAAK